MSDNQQIITWSHSRADSYRTCPRRFYEETILKVVPFVQTEPMKEGDRQHKMIDARLKDKVPFPAGYEKLERIVAPIEAAPGITYSEQKWTLNQRLQPTGWFAKDAWVRVIVDVAKLNNDQMFLGDWKTGKIKFDDHQLKLFAATGFIMFPSVQRITTAYVWLASNVIDPKVYTRDQAHGMWTELLKTPRDMQDSMDRNHWPTKPGRHCRWCGVNKLGRCRDAAEQYRGS